MAIHRSAQQQSQIESINSNINGNQRQAISSNIVHPHPRSPAGFKAESRQNPFQAAKLKSIGTSSRKSGTNPVDPAEQLNGRKQIKQQGGPPSNQIWTVQQWALG
ncbi:hypothetical protein ACLOJK_004681 [Asimina triloba]